VHVKIFQIISVLHACVLLEEIPQDYLIQRNDKTRFFQTISVLHACVLVVALLHVVLRYFLNQIARMQDGDHMDECETYLKTT
jgi:hypothetical protein